MGDADDTEFCDDPLRVYLTELARIPPLDRAVLAPARNDRRSAGKTIAVSAGFDVSRHADAVVGGER